MGVGFFYSKFRASPHMLSTWVPLSALSLLLCCGPIMAQEPTPEATPEVERTWSPSGRRREKENPVPPPDW